jgi:hypothetical protein
MGAAWRERKSEPVRYNAPSGSRRGVWILRRRTDGRNGHGARSVSFFAKQGFAVFQFGLKVVL